MSSTSPEPFFKVDDKVQYSAPDEDAGEPSRCGTITAILRHDAIVVKWEDDSISTVSENHLDLI